MSKQVTCLQIKLDFSQTQYPKFKSKLLTSNKKNNNRNKIFKTQMNNNETAQRKLINPFILKLQLDDVTPLKRKNTQTIGKEKKKISNNIFYNTFIKEKKKRERYGQFRFKSFQKSKIPINIYTPFITQTNFSEQSSIPKIRKQYFSTRRRSYAKTIQNNQQDQYHLTNQTEKYWKKSNYQSSILQSTPRRININQADKIEDDYITLKKFYNQKYNLRKSFFSKSSQIKKKKLKILINDENQIKPWASFNQQNCY